MAGRITKVRGEKAATSLTSALHEAGMLASDAKFYIQGRNGYYALEVTGGPYLGTGAVTVHLGSLRECVLIAEGYLDILGAANISGQGR